MTKEKHTSFRLTPEAKQLLLTLARQLGVSQAAVLEMAIREFAEERGFYDPHPHYSLPPAQG